MNLDQLSDEARRAVDGLLLGGQKIAAIKRVREETGAGLKEAKMVMTVRPAANTLLVNTLVKIS